MSKLKLADWANISEIGASAVVVLSLIYVGFQIDQNTTALEQDTYQSMQEILYSVDLTLATDTELLKIAMLAEKTPKETSELEWRKFSHLAFPRFATWEFVFLAREAGAVGEDHWEAMDPYFTEMLCHPGYRRFWNENIPVFSLAFARHVNTAKPTACVVRESIL